MIGGYRQSRSTDTQRTIEDSSQVMYYAGTVFPLAAQVQDPSSSTRSPSRHRAHATVSLTTHAQAGRVTENRKLPFSTVIVMIRTATMMIIITTMMYSLIPGSRRPCSPSSTTRQEELTARGNVKRCQRIPQRKRQNISLRHCNRSHHAAKATLTKVKVAAIDVLAVERSSSSSSSLQ